MSDNITLPREVVEKALEALGKGVTFKPGWVPECEDAVTALRTHLAAPTEDKTHPGYVIGSHWLETAYSRVCAGEAEDAILEDYELVREPRLRDLRRDAERYEWAVENAVIETDRFRHDGNDPCSTKHVLDAAIDAAMGDKR